MLLLLLLPLAVYPPSLPPMPSSHGGRCSHPTARALPLLLLLLLAAAAAAQDCLPIADPATCAATDGCTVVGTVSGSQYLCTNSTYHECYLAADETACGEASVVGSNEEIRCVWIGGQCGAPSPGLNCTGISDTTSDTFACRCESNLGEPYRCFDSYLKVCPSPTGTNKTACETLAAPSLGCLFLGSATNTSESIACFPPGIDSFCSDNDGEEEDCPTAEIAYGVFCHCSAPKCYAPTTTLTCTGQNDTYTATGYYCHCAELGGDTTEFNQCADTAEALATTSTTTTVAPAPPPSPEPSPPTDAPTGTSTATTTTTVTTTAYGADTYVLLQFRAGAEVDLEPFSTVVHTDLVARGFGWAQLTTVRNGNEVVVYVSLTAGDALLLQSVVETGYTVFYRGRYYTAHFHTTTHQAKGDNDLSTPKLVGIIIGSLVAAILVVGGVIYAGRTLDTPRPKYTLLSNR